MSKIRTTISIDKELLARAKNHRIGISSFLDIELRRYMALVDNGLDKTNSVGCGCRDLNPSNKLGKLM